MSKENFNSYSEGIEKLADFLHSRYRKKGQQLSFVYTGPEPDHDRHIAMSIGWNLSDAGLSANGEQCRSPIQVALIAAYRLGAADQAKEDQERIDEKDKMLDSYLKLLTPFDTKDEK